MWRSGTAYWGICPMPPEMLRFWKCPNTLLQGFLESHLQAPFCFKTADCNFKRGLNFKKRQRQINQYKNRNIFTIRHKRLCVVIKIAHITGFLFQFLLS